ncbi:MAG: hypothetical protein Q8936_23435 [Bacillota bacterium]|nr:hypothetical protein [Bacillota bacterium]
MKINIILRDLASYHPQDILHNNFFIQHFSSMDKDITSLLKTLGKEKNI